jgi:hypothetical protein
MENIRISDALQILTPGAEWSIGNNSYSQLDWLDTEQTKPTEEEVVQKVAELQYQEEVNEYQRQRAAEYPSYANQFDKIFHEGVDAWKADIQAIKDKYPKATMDATELQTRKDKAIFDLQTERYVAATKRLELDAVVASDDIPATVEVSTTNPETMEVTTETVANPVIVKDEQERASAQAVVDATPQPVIDSLG